MVYSESSKFKSYFGEVNINGFKIEIMGNYQINCKNGWSEVYDANFSQITMISVSETYIPCTTISTEMKMYLEMGRFNVYHKIKNQLQNFSSATLFA